MASLDDYKTAHRLISRWQEENPPTYADELPFSMLAGTDLVEDSAEELDILIEPPIQPPGCRNINDNGVYIIFSDALFHPIEPTSLTQSLIERLQINSVTSYETDAIRALMEKYTYKNREKVCSYLYNNQSLIDVLNEAYEELTVEFGPQTKVELEVIDDPDEDYYLLYVNILIGLSPNKACDLLSNFEDRWYFKKYDHFLEKLTFSLEFE